MFVHNKKTYFSKPEILSSRYFPHQQTAWQLKDYSDDHQTSPRTLPQMGSQWDCWRGRCTDVEECGRRTIPTPRTKQHREAGCYWSPASKLFQNR